MKKYIACMLLALALLCAAALAEYEFENGVRVITGADGKYGLENEAGEILLEPVYDEIGGFAPWPDGVERCWLIQDGNYGWYPAPGGGAATCGFSSQPELFSDYLICEDRIWDLSGNPANDTLYSRLTVLSDDRLAAWAFTGSEEKWKELYDSWGGRMDYAAEEAVVLDESLNEVFRLECDYIEPAGEGLCAFTQYGVDPEGEKWDAGYVDLNGNIACRKRTNLSLEGFESGYARSFKNGEGGANLIDLSFEKVFKEDYDWITAFIGGHAVLLNEIWEGDSLTGYRCTLVNDQLDELMQFTVGTDVNGVWCNGRIIVNDGDYGLYYVHDLDKKLLLKGKYVGAYTADDRVRYQNEQGKWGFIDGDGRNVIPAAYAAAEDFSGGFAAVQDENGKWLFINGAGENAFGRSWDYAESFRNGYAYVRDESGAYMINADGKKVRPALMQMHYISDSYSPYVPAAEWNGEIAEVYAENHGMRIFKGDDGKLGIMDAQQNILAPAVYDSIEPPVEFGDGVFRAILRRDGRYGWCGTDGFCDAKWANYPTGVFAGKTIVAPENMDSYASGSHYMLVNADGSPVDSVDYAEINIISGKLLALREAGSGITFVVDEDFRQVFSLECDEIHSESEGLYSFRRGELWGWCDGSGRVVIEPISSMTSAFSNGYAVITRYNQRKGEEDYALINTSGEIAIEFGKYEMIHGFEDGYAIIRAEDHSYPENPDGTGWIRPWHKYIIVDAQLNTCCSFFGNCHNYNQSGLFIYFDKDESVMIDARGNEIHRMDGINECTYGYSRFEEDGLYGFMDESGKIIIPARYADAGLFGKNGLCPVREEENGTWKYINIDGVAAFTVGGNYAGDFGDDEYALLDYEWYINERGEISAPFNMDDVWF